MKNNFDKNMLLKVQDLSVKVNLQQKSYYILQNISFEVEPNHIVAFSGPSGSGKTITALAMLDLLPDNMWQSSGTITFNHKNYGKHSDNSLTELRGSKIAMIFQEPQAALNPVIKIGRQLCDVIKHHNNITPDSIKNEAIQILNEVGLPEPKNIFNMYAHQLSGGMSQRVLIALALSCKPALLIADEPTTALDATSQIQIIRLLRELQAKRNFSILLISHDTQLVSTLADRVMYFEKGRLNKIESLNRVDIFNN